MINHQRFAVSVHHFAVTKPAFKFWRGRRAQAVLDLFASLLVLVRQSLHHLEGGKVNGVVTREEELNRRQCSLLRREWTILDGNTFHLWAEVLPRILKAGLCGQCPAGHRV